MFFYISFDCFESLIAYIVFYTAGIFIRGIFINAHHHKKIGKNDVAFIYALSDYLTGFGQIQKAVVISSYKSFTLKETDSPAYRRFGVSKVFTDVDSSDQFILQ